MNLRKSRDNVGEVEGGMAEMMYSFLKKIKALN